MHPLVSLQEDPKENVRKVAKRREISLIELKKKFNPWQRHGLNSFFNSIKEISSFFYLLLNKLKHRGIYFLLYHENLIIFQFFDCKEVVWNYFFPIQRKFSHFLITTQLISLPWDLTHVPAGSQELLQYGFPAQGSPFPTHVPFPSHVSFTVHQLSSLQIVEVALKQVCCNSLQSELHWVPFAFVRKPKKSGRYTRISGSHAHSQSIACIYCGTPQRIIARRSYIMNRMKIIPFGRAQELVNESHVPLQKELLLHGSPFPMQFPLPSHISITVQKSASLHCVPAGDTQVLVELLQVLLQGPLWAQGLGVTHCPNPSHICWGEQKENPSIPQRNVSTVWDSIDILVASLTLCSTQRKRSNKDFNRILFLPGPKQFLLVSLQVLLHVPPNRQVSKGPEVHVPFEQISPSVQKSPSSQGSPVLFKHVPFPPPSSTQFNWHCGFPAQGFPALTQTPPIQIYERSMHWRYVPQDHCRTRRLMHSPSLPNSRRWIGRDCLWNWYLLVHHLVSWRSKPKNLCAKSEKTCERKVKKSIDQFSSEE